MSTFAAPPLVPSSTRDTPEVRTLRRPDDWHVHLRDGAALQAVVGATADTMARAIVMPNLKPPVTTTAAALAYRARILAALGSREGRPPFEPLMTLYLTDTMPPDEIVRAHAAGIVAAKLYPAGATTHSDAGVTSVAHLHGVLEAMQRVDMPLLVHGEVTDADVDVFDREAVFVERVLAPLRRDFPALRIVLEHVTTREGAQFVVDAGPRTAGTVTAHHLLYDRNALFVGGLRPHVYCLPVLKRSTHRLALLDAVTGDSGRFFLGTDSAPHASVMKEASLCGAGCYTAPCALELYALAFEQVGRLDRLETFASLAGPAFYGLPPNEARVALVPEPWTVPETVPFGEAQLKPLAGGQTLPWRVRDAG